MPTTHQLEKMTDNKAFVSELTADIPLFIRTPNQS
jgi:hypothetical protein